MGMPSTWDIQKIMDTYNLNSRQADRFYWFRVEGYSIEQALVMVSRMQKCQP